MDDGLAGSSAPGTAPDEEMVESVRQSGVFDLAWYCATYGAEPETAIAEWCSTGWLEGRNPSFYFDTNWYLTYYIDVAAGKLNPLMHYIHHGEGEGAAPLCSSTRCGIGKPII